MEWMRWIKRVKPVRKKTLQIYGMQENELIELVKRNINSSYVKCELDSFTLMQMLNIFSALLAAGKAATAVEFCRTIAEKCLGQNPNNPYRLMFLLYALVAECEMSFYDLHITPLCPEDVELRKRYALCQQASIGLLRMKATNFKAPDLLTVCEELFHLTCFRQCHVNLLKNLSEIGEDDNVDWYDRAKVLDSHIMVLINDSDIPDRLSRTDKEKREFLKNLQQLPISFLESNDQYCFSWFNQLRLREICVRATAATEVLKSDQAFKTFAEMNTLALPRSSSLLKAKSGRKRNCRRLLPRNPELEADMKTKRISFGEDSGVVADANMLIVRKTSKTIARRRIKKGSQEFFPSEVDDCNYQSAIFDNEKSFSLWNAAKIKEQAQIRKDRVKKYASGGSDDCRKRMPENVRKQIRIILRNIMAVGREIQKRDVPEDEQMNLAFPVSDDEFSDDEYAPHPFVRTETIDTLRQKSNRTFGKLNSKSETKPVLWWHNAKDELLTTRAVSNHCVKINGESSEPFDHFERYLGRVEPGQVTKDRMSESTRNVKAQVFPLDKIAESGESTLFIMASSTPFKTIRFNSQRPREAIGLNSLYLQNMRRRCIDELLIMLMIINGEQQLQDGNVIRCLAYMMLIEYKFAVFEETLKSNSSSNKNMYQLLKKLHKHLVAKFQLYATDLLGLKCLSPFEEKILLDGEKTLDFNADCYNFCKNTGTYFFCVCVRGRTIQLDVYESGNEITIRREDIEQQHEFFFGLDKVNQNSQLNNFWRTECMPIIAGLVNMAGQNLVNSIDVMDREESSRILESMPGLSHQTREWLRQVTQNGILKQTTKRELPHDPQLCTVPVIFQLPSRNDDSSRTIDMAPKKDFRQAYKMMTGFVCEAYGNWKALRKEERDIFSAQNSDYNYNKENDMSIIGDSIDKNVYMVAMYKGKKNEIEVERFQREMHALCRKLRSQSEFIAIKQQFPVAKYY